jgi:3-phosphoshikimate 1-carboxyvinyltransferase
MDIPSAQIKSAILFAALYADGVTTIEEKFKSRDHTERMLKYFGARIKMDNLRVSLKGPAELTARELEVPGDMSSASFFIAGAVLLKGSKIKIRNVGLNSTRTGIIDVLQKMGACIKISNKKDLFEPVGDIEIEGSDTKGVMIEEGAIPSMIDELPIIFVVAALSKGVTTIRGAEELKVKETDRIRSMKENIEAMGGKVSLHGGDILIEGARGFAGANIKSFGDHRTCMAMAIAALSARGESEIDNTDCINKSFPEFFKILNQSNRLA